MSPTAHAGGTAPGWSVRRGSRSPITATSAASTTTPTNCAGVARNGSIAIWNAAFPASPTTNSAAATTSPGRPSHGAVRRSRVHSSATTIGTVVLPTACSVSTNSVHGTAIPSHGTYPTRRRSAPT